MPLPVPEPNKARGCNYLPSRTPKSGTAHNFWLCNSVDGTFDLARLQTELDKLASVDTPIVRLFQSYWTFAYDRAEHLTTLQKISAECYSRGIKVMLCLFEGVSGESYDNGLLADPRNAPWYDPIGTTGAGTFSFATTSRIGPLVTILDLFTAAQTAAVGGAPRYTGFEVGGWLDAPGVLYVVGYDHTQYTYPTLPFAAGVSGFTTVEHDLYLQSMLDYIDQSITAMRSADHSVLWSVDVWNEPEAGNLRLLDLALHAATLAEYPSINATNYLLRWQALARYFLAHIRAQHPDVPTTFGHVTFSDATIAEDFGQIDADFYSWHNYGNGFLVRDDVRSVAEQAAERGKQVVLSEYSRGIVWSDDQLVEYHRLMQDVGMGGLAWELFETPAFQYNSSNYPTNWAPSPAISPSNQSIGDTGILRSYGTPQKIVERRPDILAEVAKYHRGEEVTPQPHYIPKITGPYQWTLVDQYGRALPETDTTTVNWRWIIVAPKDRLDSDYPDANNNVAFSDYPGISRAIDTSTQQTKVGTGAGTLDLSGSPPGTGNSNLLLVQAWYGDEEYDVTNWENTQINLTRVWQGDLEALRSGGLNMATGVRVRTTGLADTGGITWDNLPVTDPHLKQDWMVAPVHEPGWFVDDTSVEDRAAGHKYRIPVRRYQSGSYDPLTATFDREAWASPTAADLRQIKPPSGFPTVSFRLASPSASAATAALELYVRGYDGQLRRREEIVRLEMAGGSEVIVWGQIGWRQIQEVEVLRNTLDVNNTTLEIGWYLEARDSGSQFDEPHEVGRNSSVAVQLTKAGDANDTLKIWDGVNSPVTFTLVASGASGSQVNIGGSAAATASNLKTVFDAQVSGGSLGNWLSAAVVSDTVTITSTGGQTDTRKSVWSRPPSLGTQTPPAQDSFSVTITAGDPLWVTAFPTALKRDAALGFTKTRQVDGYIFGDSDSWIGDDRGGFAHGLTADLMGGFGGTPHRGTPAFESGQFNITEGTWGPAYGARPLTAAGISGGSPANQTQFRLYRFLLNHRPVERGQVTQ